MKVVALGDSVTAGSRCDCAAFPQLYATGLESRYGVPIQLTNDGRGGQTSDTVLADLDSTSREEADVAAADVVLVTIGANDFSQVHEAIVTNTCGLADRLSCARQRLLDLGRKLAAILGRIHDLRAGQSNAVLVTGYWNVFEDGDVARSDFSREGQDASDQLTQAVNLEIATAASEADATYIDLYRPFKGADGSQDPTHLLADDGDHPNAPGHRVIAQTLLAAPLSMWPAR
jgi:lysophospholipase L1-like esterase